MPEIFLPASSRAAASPDVRRRDSADTSAQGTNTPPDAFARTLQTQMDDRQSAARRAQNEAQRPSEPQRPNAEQAARSAQAAEDDGARAAPAHRASTAAEAGRPEAARTQRAGKPAAQAVEDDAAKSDKISADTAAAADAGNLAAAQVAATPLQTTSASTPACDPPSGEQAMAGQDAAADADQGQAQSHAHAQALPVPQDPARQASPEGGDAAASNTTVDALDAPLRATASNLRDTPTPLRAETANAGATDTLTAAPESTPAHLDGKPVEQGTQAGAGNFLSASLRSQATPAAPTPTAFVSTPTNHAGFADDVGQRVVLFAGRGESKAELILTPAHLGRVEVTLTISAEQATAQFVASSNAARDALEQAMPRLREMLAEAGIQLGESHVGTRSDQEGREAPRGSAFGGSDFAAGADTTSGARQWIRQGVGMIDTFA